MGYIILIVVAIAIIYGIIKLIIWITPFIARGFLILLAVGGVIGMLVGIFYGIKNYFTAVNNNITNTPFRVLMNIITIVFIVIAFMLLFAFIYYTFSYTFG